VGGALEVIDTDDPRGRATQPPLLAYIILLAGCFLLELVGYIAGLILYSIKVA
jgi:hypothetical protein